MRVWADLDLDGVRIARVRQRLMGRFAAAVKADLEARPGALLAGTLRAILEEGNWVEQEVFLGRAATVTEDRAGST